MTDDMMWSAVIGNDVSYDGQFYYAVKTTGIYCRPSCKSKTPNRENVEYYESGDAARLAGYRPCKRCRSDLPRYEPEQEIADQMKDLIQRLYNQPKQLDSAYLELGISKAHRVEIFKRVHGATPKAYADTLRLDEAKRRLVNSNEKIISIAYEVGLNSVSAFYRLFKKQTGTSPRRYREDYLNE